MWVLATESPLRVELVRATRTTVHGLTAGARVLRLPSLQGRKLIEYRRCMRLPRRGTVFGDSTASGRARHSKSRILLILKQLQAALVGGLVGFRLLFPKHCARWRHRKKPGNQCVCRFVRQVYEVLHWARTGLPRRL